ncbi:MAG: hypothetical protein VX252_14440, partial [Myxococcota bacterium]|nr:hypothetical protein [Myxococcota bacterium]
ACPIIDTLYQLFVNRRPITPHPQNEKVQLRRDSNEESDLRHFGTGFDLAIRRSQWLAWQ